MTTPITLYGITGSRTSRNLWLLEELGVEYARKVISFKDKGTHKPAFLEINPNGQIPALVDGETVVWESLAINLYLAKKYGGALAAGNLHEEGESLKWSFWGVTELEKNALTILLHCAVLPLEMRDSAAVKQAEEALQKPLAVLNAHLENQDFMMGARFTVLDVNLAAMCNWVSFSKVLQSAPNVARWLSACLARPAYVRVQGFAKTETVIQL